MDFVIIANAWTAAADNPTGKHQIALQLAAKGHRVLWIEGSGMRKPSASSGADRSRIVGKLKTAAKGIQKAQPGIWRTAPLIVPMPTQPLVRALNAIIYTAVGVLGSTLLRFKRPTLINFLPVVPLAEMLWPWKKIYFCVDRWDKFDMYDTTVMSHVDDACCRNANVVLTTSNDLQTRCEPKNPRTTLIGHGVNWDHFSAPLQVKTEDHRPQTTDRRPEDLPEGRIVGFFGLLSEWVDQDLLISLAQALREANTPPSPNHFAASIVLIGKADVDISRLEAEPNIHILGPKTFSELPAYTAFFDVAIIPFIINELTIAVNPIKLREMLAAGCPVVSTALPEVDFVAQQTDYAETVATAEAFVAAALKRLDEPATHEHRAAISDTMRTETWSAKVDQILNVIDQSP
jgi:glycosyltransferase involved in cell wall biosynthesis